MATSTLIQFLEPGEKAATSNRRQVETFLASGAIAIGDWVAFDDSQTGADKMLFVEESTASAGGGLVCGVAISAATAADDKIDVVIGGFVAVAQIVGAITAGDPLRQSATVGAADAATAGAEAVIGVALTTLAGPGAATAEVWVYNRF